MQYTNEQLAKATYKAAAHIWGGEEWMRICMSIGQTVAYLYNIERPQSADNTSAYWNTVSELHRTNIKELYALMLERDTLFKESRKLYALADAEGRG